MSAIEHEKGVNGHVRAQAGTRRLMIWSSWCEPDPPNRGKPGASQQLLMHRVILFDADPCSLSCTLVALGVESAKV